jgi:chemotaxis signal transduction protein
LPADDALVPGAMPSSPDAADATGAATSADAGGALAAAHRERACIFAMGGCTLAADVRETREVMTLDAVGAVPGAPEPLLGVTNLRGTVLAVADAGVLLGLTPKLSTSGGSAIVLNAGGLRAAVPIDAVLGLEWFDTPLPADHLPDGALRTFAAGIVPRPDQPAILLDVARLLEALRAPWAPAAPEAQG